MSKYLITSLLVGSLLLAGCESSKFGSNADSEKPNAIESERADATNPLLYVLLGVALAALAVSQSSSKNSDSGLSCYWVIGQNTQTQVCN